MEEDDDRGRRRQDVRDVTSLGKEARRILETQRAREGVSGVCCGFCYE